VCTVSDDHADSCEFDITAPPGFLNLTEQEILEKIMVCDDDAADILEAALTNDSPLYLNGGNMSREALVAALAARPGSPTPA